MKVATAATMTTAAALSFIAHPAVAKDWKLALVPTAEQTVEYREGRQVVFSKRPPRSGASLVLVTDRFGLKQSPMLHLTVKNYTSDTVNFTQANVRVNSDAGPVAIQSISDIEAEARSVEKKAKQAAMWQAIAVGLQAGSASAPQTSTYSATSFTPYGSVNTFGTLTTPGNQAASNAILARGQSQIQATREQGRAAAAQIMEGAEDLGFRPATVAPDGFAETPLTLDRLPRKAKHLTVVVDFNGETHTFAFDLAQVK